MNTLNAPIQRVTVYTDRARVSREGHVFLEAGEHTITLEQLPITLEEKTVRAASTNAALRIIDVNVEIQTLPAPDAAVVQALQDEYDALKDEDESLIDFDRVEANRLLFLRDISNSASDTLGAALARGEVPVENIDTLMAYMAEQQEASNRRRRDIARQRRVIEKRIVELHKRVPAGARLRTRNTAQPTPPTLPTPQKKEDDENPAASLLRRRRGSSERSKPTPERPPETPPPSTARRLGPRFSLSNKRKRITLTVQVSEAGQFDLNLSYSVTNAAWQPLYDVRVDGNGQYCVSFLAAIQQNTGEDWPAVPIALSTARPAQDANMPKLRPWVLDAERPATPPRRMPFGRHNDDTNKRAFGSMRRPPAPKPQQPDRRSPFGLPTAERPDERKKGAAPSVKFEDEPAQINGLVPTVSFDVQQALEIASNNNKHKVFVETFEMDGELDLVAIPELAENAILCAHIKNISEQMLLRGQAAIFYGTEFIGKTELDNIAPGRRFTVQLGEQERVRVERQLEKHSVARTPGNDNRSRTEFIYRIKVHNDGNEPIDLLVYDHVPIARHKDIIVHVRAMSPQPENRTERNIFTWRVLVEPNKPSQITMGFALDHPHDMQIVSKRT